MKTRIVKVRKTYKGKVSLRNYAIETAIREGDAIRIEYGKEYMVLTPKQLAEDGKLDPHIHISRFNSSSYQLVDYKWNGQSDKIKGGSFGGRRLQRELRAGERLA